MLAARTIARRVPRLAVVPVRYKSSGVEGSVAQSREFSKKEKAHEDEYARRHEMELLRKLKAQIDSKKVELDALQKEHSELEKKNGGSP